MSMASDLFVAIGRGHQNSLTLWANKYKVHLPKGGAWKDRVKFATELLNHEKEQHMKTVTKPSTKSKKAVEEVEEEEEEVTTKKGVKKEAKSTTIGSKDVADMLGVSPAALRRYLRAKGHNTEGEYARYEWEPDSPRLNKLLKEFKANQENVEKNRAENLKKGRVEKGGGKKGSAKKNEDIEEGEEEEEVEDLD